MIQSNIRCDTFLEYTWSKLSNTMVYSNLKLLFPLNLADVSMKGFVLKRGVRQSPVNTIQLRNIASFQIFLSLLAGTCMKMLNTKLTRIRSNQRTKTQQNDPRSESLDKYLLALNISAKQIQSICFLLQGLSLQLQFLPRSLQKPRFNAINVIQNNSPIILTNFK